MIWNWNDFDDKLREIALIDIGITAAGRVRDLALISAETRYKDSTGTRVAARASLAKDLEAYYRKNRREVEAEGARSKTLHFGRVGIRATAAAFRLRKGLKWPDIVANLKAKLADWKKFVTVKESVNKEALKRSHYGADEFAEIDVTLKGGDEFFIETFPEKLAPEVGAN